mgnify:CR=1 FL=1
MKELTNLYMAEAPMMSSREIAELCDKRHSDVMRDIRVMVEQLEQNANLRFVYKSSTYVAETGQSYPQYELDRDTTLCLVAGYNVELRMKIIKRWGELEAAYQKALTPEEMLLGMAQRLVDHSRRIAAQEVELEQHKHAIKKLEENVDYLKDETHWVTALGAAGMYGFELTKPESASLGKVLSTASRKMGIEIKKRFSPEYGSIGLYHVNVVKHVIEECGYFN